MNLETKQIRNLRQYSYLFLVTLLMAVLSPQQSIAQDTETEKTGFSFNPKIGIYGTTADREGIVGGMEVNLLKNGFIYSIDFYKFNELAFFRSPLEDYTQLGLMIGKYKDHKMFRFQYQAGLSLFQGTKRVELIVEDPIDSFTSQYRAKNFATVGLLSKLGFKIIPLPFLSIGVDLQANINVERPLFMPMLSIEIGNLRN